MCGQTPFRKEALSAFSIKTVRARFCCAGQQLASIFVLGGLPETHMHVCSLLGEGTYGHHHGGDVGMGGQFPFTASALSCQNMHKMGNIS